MPSLALTLRRGTDPVPHRSVESFGRDGTGAAMTAHCRQNTPSYPSTSIPVVATFCDLFARLDPDPRVRGKQFEHPSSE
jgi:hypothetical protein